MLPTLAAVSVLAVWFDLRERRIPNWLTVGALAAALALRLLSVEHGVWPGVASAAIALAFGFPFFLAGGLGAGDVKLMAALAAFLDPGKLGVAMLVMALAGGAMAIWSASRQGLLAATLANTYVLIRTLGRRTFTGWETAGGQPRVRPGAVTNPYALAIVVGALAGWFS